MQLRKVCNHPFLFPGAEAAIRGGEHAECDETICTSSNKMMMLDRLLARLKKNGNRVVIFSQFTHTLDIIDDYLNLRGYSFTRLDGSTGRVQRMVNIQVRSFPLADIRYQAPVAPPIICFSWANF